MIADLAPALLDFLNAKYNSDLVKDNIRGWNLWEYGRIRKEDCKEGIRDFIASGKYGELSLINGAKEALQRIASVHSIYIVTWRSSLWKDDTINWLKKHKLNFYKEIYFSENKQKDDICRAIGADLAIDDNLNQARAMSVLCPVLLFDQPWNRTEEEIQNVIRVYCWTDVLCYLGLLP